MFTDGPVTPVRLEVLLVLLAEYSNGLKRDEIYDLLQPPPLADSSQITAKNVLSAAIELGLAEEHNKSVILSKMYNKKLATRENVLRATDEKVLSNLKIEAYLALYYAYYLGLNKKVYERQNINRDEWVELFNKEVFNNEPQKNPFNTTKHTGLDRWFCYLGLGWVDPSGLFQANPYERLLRAIPSIFMDGPKMKDDQFMAKMAKICPELDGGNIFLQANKYKNYSVKDKQCSLGLSHALLDLHEDKIIRLYCPMDSRGWNIGLGQPSRDDTITSDRITVMEYLGK